MASVNYRYSSQAIFPAQIHDVKAAVRWLRGNAAAYRLDPQRFGAWGMSAGGHLVALLGTSAGVAAMDGELGPPDQSTRVQAVVDWFGPTDLLQMDAQRLPNGMTHNRPKFAGVPAGGRTASSSRSCEGGESDHVRSPDDPPFLIMHGDRDTMVP